MTLPLRLSAALAIQLVALAIASTATAGGTGIKLHSVAVISVRDAHGVTIRHVETSADSVNINAVTDLLLGRKLASGKWELVVDGSACPALGSSACYLGLPSGGPTVAARPGTVRGAIDVTGAWTAAATGNVTEIDARLETCRDDRSPRTCHGHGSYDLLTQNTLSSPVAVTHGQVVNVTVTITIG